MGLPNRRARRAAGNKRRFMPGLSVIAGAGLLSGYIPYLRPAAASTPCVVNFPLDGDSTAGALEIDLRNNIVRCNEQNKSTVTFNFVLADSNEDVNIQLDEDIDIEFDDLYNRITTLNFAEGISFSSQVVVSGGYTNYYGGYYVDPVLESGSYGFSISNSSGHYNGEIEINGLELEWSRGIQISDFDKVTASNLLLSNNNRNATSAATLSVFSYDDPIGVSEGSELVLTDSRFAQNGTMYASSAVFVSGSAQVSGSTFYLNRASGNGAALYVKETIYESGLTVNDSQFSYSYSSSSGGAIYTRADSVVISDSTFSYNQSFKGGAINSLSDGIALSSSTFIGNSATDAGGAVYVEYNEYGTSLTVTESSFRSNTAMSGVGGAIGGNELTNTVIDGTTFIQNTQAGNDFEGGGAIGLIGFAGLSLRNSTFIGNQRTGNAGYVAGGGVFAIFDPTVSPTVEVVSNTFIDNFAPYLLGGALNRFEGASVHLYSYAIYDNYVNSDPDSEPFKFLGNIFTNSSSIYNASGPGAIMVGSSQVTNFLDGQREESYYNYGVAGSEVEALFNISDDFRLRELSLTNQHNVTFDQLEFGSLTNAPNKPKSRSIRSGSIADNFVRRSTLTEFASILPEFDQQGTRRGSSAMDAGAFEFTGGGGGGFGGALVGNAEPKSSFLSPFKFDSPKLSRKQKRQIRAEFAANPFTTTVSCQPFVTKAKKVADRKAARAAARAACAYIQKRYPTVFVRVEPLRIVSKADPKNRRVQISLG